MADSLSKKQARRKHFKWLAVSALVAALIIALCGPSGSCTNPLCTWIQTVMPLLPSPTETPQNAPQGNLKEGNISPLITHYDQSTFQNLYDDCVNPSAIKSAISIAENMATKTNDLIIISASSIMPFMTDECSKMMKAFILIHLKASKNSGLSDSQRFKNLTLKPPRIPRNTHLKKSPAKKQKSTIFVATNMEMRTGCCQNIYACQPAAKNLAA